jgi:hypothetical protein
MSACLMHAQNHFVYVRYSPKDGNVSAVISAIEELKNQSDGQVVVFISKASTPIVATKEKEWFDAREALLSMQVEFDYYPQEEATLLNTYFMQYFMESVSSSLHIRGENDNEWTTTFIVSENMLQSDEFEYLAESIYVSELLQRMDVDIFTYNGYDNRLSSVDIPENKLFLFDN